MSTAHLFVAIWFALIGLDLAVSVVRDQRERTPARQVALAFAAAFFAVAALNVRRLLP